MAWAKRIVLFLAVNILVMVTLSLVLNLFGVSPYLNTQYGIDFTQLAIFCLVWGMGGAFISLALSRVMAKWMMGVKIIDPQTRDPELQALVQTVHSLARAAGISSLPQVGIYESPEINAFATGPTKNRSLVAVSTGLLSRMNREEIEGVLGHEVAHVANGDMVTMTLVQGVVNAFVMFLARALAFVISQSMRRDDDRGTSPFLHYALVFLFEMVFMIFGTMVVAWFSRWREFRADSGGARLAGRDSMIAALRALQRTIGQADDGTRPAVAALKISGRRSGFLALFSTHPPLEDRIAALETMRI